MNALPAVHLCIIQPGSYMYSLGFLDQARYFRYQFRRLGADVTIAKNRLRHDAVNFVFGAHLGFDTKLRRRYGCIFVNLEQLGEEGANVSGEYINLLRTSAVVDYDLRNVSAYAEDPLDVPVVPLLYAPYLDKPKECLPVGQRPIDVLFFGSLNDRRKAMIDQIEAAGAAVAMFDSPLFGEERDQYIRQSKCVFNAHFYGSSRFEQARVAHCLSLGTPVVSERSEKSAPHVAFEDSVFWVTEAGLRDFFSVDFRSEEFERRAQTHIRTFHKFDPVEDYAELLAFAEGFNRAHQERRPADPWKPTHINIGAGRHYKPGWLNVCAVEHEQPDVVIDMEREVHWPLEGETSFAGPIAIESDSADIIYANNVLEHVVALPRLMTNCLAWLKTGGQLVVEIPYDSAHTDWQDPAHVRAMNEYSWRMYSDHFWHMGWFSHRFELTHLNYLDGSQRICSRDVASFMRVVMTKVETTPRERTTARVMQTDFGGVPADLHEVANE